MAPIKQVDPPITPPSLSPHAMSVKEAIRIADVFAKCTDGLKWYDTLGWSGCSLIYTIRAEGAMFWFISCNGGIPFQG